MKRRQDWFKFKEVLDQYNLNCFYHFTDRSNIPSIIKNGGLFSYSKCIEEGIDILRPGGSCISHELDKKYDLDEYVHLSVCKHHPMMYNALKDDRIKDPVILEIDTDVLFERDNCFSDKNAVKQQAKIGSSLEHFQMIHFETIQNNQYWDLDENEKDYYQAEILVKKFIPLCYIKNISSYFPENSSSFSVPDNDRLVIFLISQSSYTAGKTLYNGIETSRSYAISDTLNSILSNYVVGYSHNDIKYQFAIRGYGDYCYNCFEGKLRHSSIVSINDLQNNPIDFQCVNKEIKTRNGLKIKEIKKPIWIKHKSSGEANLISGLKNCQVIAKSWIKQFPNCKAPTVIHITDSAFTNSRSDEVLLQANELCQLYTNRSHCRLYNVLVNPVPENESIELFPGSMSQVKHSKYHELYALMSSYITLKDDSLLYNVEGHSSLGFAYNVPLDQLYNILIKIMDL